MGNSEKVPSVVIRPILFPVHSVNQMAPSGPASMPSGWAWVVGTGYSEMVPGAVIRPMLPAWNSVSHTIPPAPTATSSGWLLGVGTRNSRPLTRAWAAGAAVPTRRTTNSRGGSNRMRLIALSLSRPPVERHRSVGRRSMISASGAPVKPADRTRGWPRHDLRHVGVQVQPGKVPAQHPQQDEGGPHQRARATTGQEQRDQPDQQDLRREADGPDDRVGFDHPGVA